MATKTRRKIVSRNTDVEMDTMDTSPVTTPTYPTATATTSTESKATAKPLFWIVILLALLVFWWWKTNTWPVVAVVGGKPIFRHDVDKTLYSQYGEQTVTGLVTQYQIEEALNSKNITVTDKEVDDKLNELKTRLPAGSDFESELKAQGLTLQSLKDLLKIQLRLNKVAEGQASVSAEEVASYIKTNEKMMTATTAAEKKTEAEQALQQEKMNTTINKFVEDAQKSGSVWWWPTYKMVTPTPAAAPAK